MVTFSSRFSLIFATILCCALCGTVDGKTAQQVRFVSVSTGSDTSGDGSQGNPWQTIAYALSQITNASDLNRYEVRVASGTYISGAYQGGSRKYVVLKRWTSLLGGFEPIGWTRDIAANQTVIKPDSPSSASVVVEMAGDVRLDGFHITRDSHSTLGTGVRCSQVTSATISNNIIDGLTTGILCEKGSAVTIQGNQILLNTEFGIESDDSSLQVLSTTIQLNMWSGISCTDTDFFISGSQILGNGGGLLISGATAVITANVIDGNVGMRRTGGGGIVASGAIIEVSGNLIMNNNNRSFPESEGGGVSIEEGTATVTGNTIRTNRTMGHGGGVSFNHSAGVLHGNIIERNHATQSGGGGGVMCADSSVVIEGNTISGNFVDGDDGGGILAIRLSGAIEGNLISDNMAIFRGGGIYVLSGQNTVIRNNCIVRNSARAYGGGVFVRSALSSLVNNTIADNFSEGIYLEQSQLCRIHNCIISGNSSLGIERYLGVPPEVRYCLLNQPFAGEGNLTSHNPLFVDSSNNDYHLRDGSAAIDRGSLALATPVDNDGNPRPGDDGLVDMGAYESPGDYIPGEPSTTPRRWYVRTEAPEGGDGISWETSLRTIEAALALRQASDSIWVASGTYTGHWIIPPGVSLIGGFSGIESALEERNLKTCRTTIVNASPGFSVVHLGSKSLLDGFIVTGGEDGGVRCSYVTSVTVTNNIITANHSRYSGSFAGGGVSIRSSTGLFSNNVISKNSSGYLGGGIDSRDSVPLFAGNTIVDNTAASSGGAVQHSVRLPKFVNCIFWGNSTPYFNGPPGSVLPITYSDIQGGYTGEGNIGADPLLVNSAMGDYHLSANSPCVGKGVGPTSDPDIPLTDFEGDVREGTTCDIGADESTLPTALRDWMEY